MNLLKYFSSVALLGMWWLAYPTQLCKIALVCGLPRIVRLVCSCPLLPFPPQSIRCGLPHRDGFWSTAHWYVRHMLASEWRVVSLDKVLMWRTNNTIGRQHVCKAHHSAQHAGMLRSQDLMAAKAGSYSSLGRGGGGAHGTDVRLLAGARCCKPSI